MGKLIVILSGIGMLIAIYLFLSRSKDTVNVINSLASNATKGISTLQGR